MHHGNVFEFRVMCNGARYAGDNVEETILMVLAVAMKETCTAEPDRLADGTTTTLKFSEVLYVYVWRGRGGCSIHEPPPDGDPGPQRSGAGQFGAKILGSGPIWR